MTLTGLIGALSALMNAIVGFFNWLHDRKLIDYGVAKQKLEALQGQIHETQIALAAREAVRADIARNGDKLPERDPFLRD